MFAWVPPLAWKPHWLVRLPNRMGFHSNNPPFGALETNKVPTPTSFCCTQMITAVRYSSLCTVLHAYEYDATNKGRSSSSYGDSQGAFRMRNWFIFFSLFSIIIYIGHFGGGSRGCWLVGWLVTNESNSSLYGDIMSGKEENGAY